MQSTHRSIGTAVTLFSLAIGIASGSMADWPSAANEPLLVGAGGLMTDSGRQGVVHTGDGSVWTAWVDDMCFGALRVQRVASDGTTLVPDGLVVQTFPGCNTPRALIAALDDGSIVVARDELNDLPLEGMRLHRVDANGTSLWGDGVGLAELLPDNPSTGRFRGLLGLPGGDLMVVAQTATTLHALRLAPDGSPVWDAPLSIVGSGAVNMSVFHDLAPDSEGGVLLVWDIHASPSYFRVILAARIDADGAAVWEGTTRVVTPTNPFASRHTPHSFVPDGIGGLWAVYTRGGQQVDTPRPIDVQHLRADGTLEFETPLRASLSADLQVSATAWRDESTGDLLVAWREGLFGVDELRVQRLTADGQRLFGDMGLFVDFVTGNSTANLISGNFDGDTLGLVSAHVPADPDAASVTLHRIGGDGTILGAPIAISGPEQAVSLRAVGSLRGGDAQVVSWLRKVATLTFEPVLQLVQSDGTIGLPQPSADLNGDGVVDGADLGILLSAWGPCVDCAADLNGDGVVDGADLGMLLAAWTR